MVLAANDDLLESRPISVDIVVDNYNCERFVGDAIESALAQEHEPVHVIVVDDGSTDGSRDVIDAFADRVTVVQKENGGQASALNAGFAHARGEVVIFLDGDDMLAPAAATLAAAAFARQPTLAKIQFRMEVIDGHGRRTGVLKPPTHLRLPEGDLRRHELTFPFDVVWPPTSGNAFPAWVLRKLMPMPEPEFRLAADYYISHLAPLYGPVVSLDDVAAYYRMHDANGYEQAEPALDLGHVRQTIAYSSRTRRHLEERARELDLPWGRDGILSVSELANRLVSLKLDRKGHPVAHDTTARLALDGVRAALRRFDIAPTLRLLLAGWFPVTAVAPKPLARQLAELFLFPERRPRANRLLGALHRRAVPERATARRESFAAESPRAADPAPQTLRR